MSASTSKRTVSPTRTLMMSRPAVFAPSSTLMRGKAAVVVVAGGAVVVVPTVVRVVVACSEVDVGLTAVVVDVASGFLQAPTTSTSANPKKRSRDMIHPRLRRSRPSEESAEIYARLLPSPGCSAPEIGQSSFRHGALPRPIGLGFLGRIDHFRMDRAVLRRVQAEESGRWHQHSSAERAKNQRAPPDPVGSRV